MMIDFSLFVAATVLTLMAMPRAEAYLELGCPFSHRRNQAILAQAKVEAEGRMEQWRAWEASPEAQDGVEPMVERTMNREWRVMERRSVFQATRTRIVLGKYFVACDYLS